MENQSQSNKEDKPVLKTEYTDLTPKEESGVHFVDLDGTIETLDVDPTGKPRDLYGQIKINGVNGTISFYDTKNNVWITLGSETTYGGRVANNAVNTPFPADWTFQNTATGTYAITHNLGTENYALAITPDSTQVRAIDIVNRSSTTFSVVFKDSGGTNTDTDFHFILKIEE